MITVKQLQSEYNAARSSLDDSLSVSIKSKVQAYIDTHAGVSKTQANRIVRTEHKEIHDKALTLLVKLNKAGVAIANVRSYKNSDSVSFRSRKVIEHQIDRANKRANGTADKATKPRKVRNNKKSK